MTVVPSLQCSRMAGPEKIEKYEHLLNNVLRENLRSVYLLFLLKRDEIFNIHGHY